MSLNEVADPIPIYRPLYKLLRHVMDNLASRWNATIRKAIDIAY